MRRTQKIVSFLGLIILVSLIRIFAIGSMTILSQANKPLLQPGDNILVSKIHYGPRLPFTGLRLSGWSRIQRGDLLAFNFPEGDSVMEGMGSISYYSFMRKKETENDTLTSTGVRYRPLGRRAPEVNRCVGLPGDTITIRAGYQTIPGYLQGSETGDRKEISSRFASLPYISMDYLVEVNGRQLPPDFLTRLGLGTADIQVLPGLGYLMPLMDEQVELVRERPEVTSLEKYLFEPDRGDYNIFPHHARYPWNRDNFGPVIVPRKGDSIRLTLLNLCIYQRIIEVYEKNHLEVLQDQILINGSPATAYTFKMDYFFVLGDNRHHSRDSRHWGFLPENHIIGKPILIWFSANKTAAKPLKIYWNRIFNTL